MSRHPAPFADVLGPRATPLLPSAHAGLTCWLEADHGVGGGVIRDRSGRGNHGSLIGTASAGIVGGRPAITTVTADGYIEIAASTDLDPSPTLGFSAYLVYDTTTASAQAQAFGRWAAAAAGWSWLLSVNAGASTAGVAYISETGTHTLRGVTLAQDCSTGAVRVLRLRYDPTGNVRASVGATAYGPTAIAGVKAVAATVTIGRAYAAENTLGAAMNFRAALIYQRDLPAAEDVAVRNYLGRRWGAA